MAEERVRIGDEESDPESESDDPSHELSDDWVIDATTYHLGTVKL
jgi:hypothetical protein